MTPPRWLSREIVLAIHAELIAEHGGASGLRDADALESALTRAPQTHHYEKADLATLGAAYAYGLRRNHPFVDGNKRVSLACLDVFLRLNGHELTASEVDATSTVMDLAAGSLLEDRLAAWVQAHLSPWEPPRR